MMDETVSSDPQPLGEYATGKEWSQMQEMLSVALDRVEDKIFELTGAERTHKAMTEMNAHILRVLQGVIHKIPGNGIPVERDVISCCFMAVGLARRMIEKWEDPQEAVHCFAVAGYALGILEARKALPSVAGRIAANARHAENHAIAESIRAWWRKNGANFTSMDDAAIAVMKIEPVSFRTAYKHIAAEAKKLRSARKM